MTYENYAVHYCGVQEIRRKRLIVLNELFTRSMTIKHGGDFFSRYFDEILYWDSVLKIHSPINVLNNSFIYSYS
jgi:hypothetical protein